MIANFSDKCVNSSEGPRAPSTDQELPFPLIAPRVAFCSLLQMVRTPHHFPHRLWTPVVMLSQTRNSVRTEDAGSHQCRVSSQSESADETPPPQLSARVTVNTFTASLVTSLEVGA